MTESKNKQENSWQEEAKRREEKTERQVRKDGYYKPPSFLEMARSFKKTALKFIKEGAPIVEPSVYTSRLGECNDCEFLQRNNMRCNSCGCLLEAKAQMKNSYCPEGKWENGMAPKRDGEK